MVYIQIYKIYKQFRISNFIRQFKNKLIFSNIISNTQTMKEGDSRQKDSGYELQNIVKKEEESVCNEQMYLQTIKNNETQKTNRINFVYRNFGVLVGVTSCTVPESESGVREGNGRSIESIC